MKPGHLDFDPEPCRAGLPQVSTGAGPTHSRCGGLIDPGSLWGFSHQQELGWKVLLLWLQGIWAGGTNQSEYKPQLPGILHVICVSGFVFVHFSEFLYLWLEGRRDRVGWHSPDALTKCTGADAGTAAPRLFICCLLPCAQNLSFRNNKIAVLSNFHNALRGPVSFLQWYMNSLSLVLPERRPVRKHPTQPIGLEHTQL